MNDITPSIRCRKCEAIFQPDMKTRGVWICPRCDGKNPNLNLHYRSLGTLFILGLIFNGMITYFGFREQGLHPQPIFSAAYEVLLLVTTILVYKSRIPWTDTVAKTMIWVVFGISFLDKVAAPLVLPGESIIPAIVFFTIIIPYLVWLHFQTRKCTVSEPPPVREEE